MDEKTGWTSLPGTTPQQWIDSGYMKRADTLDELPPLCGIDAANLKAEVERFNDYCATGKGLDYNRGGWAFDRAHGDHTVTPNPCLGAIEQGPFYAVAIYHHDVSTAGGVAPDQYARVLRKDGSPILSLYAFGNVSAPVRPVLSGCGRQHRRILHLRLRRRPALCGMV